MILAWLWRRESPDVVLREARAAVRLEVLTPHWIALVWLALIFGGTELWYRVHERQLIERPRWEANWPARNPTTSHLSIPQSTRVILHYDDAKSGAWEEPPGVRWWSFFARWKPQRAALQLVRSHSPEICLPAIGRTFRGARPTLNLSPGSTPLEFRSYEFEQNGRPLFVFVCIQEDKRVAASSTDSEEWSLRGRLRAALQGKRNLGQRLLSSGLRGWNAFEQARERSRDRRRNRLARKPTG